MVARVWPPASEQPRWVRGGTAEEAERLRRHADAYDELLMTRLAQRGEHSAALATGGEVPGEEDTLLDTALYLAASRENARAAVLLRRERLGLAAMAGVIAACVALARKAWSR